MVHEAKFLINYSFAIRMALIIVILISSSFLQAELFAPILIICGFIAVIVSNGKLKRSLFDLIIPLLIIFLLGLFGISHHERRHILRDMAYALTPVALLITGFWISDNKKMQSYFFRVLLFGGFIIALAHLSKLVIQPELFTTDIKTIRYEAANPSVDLVTLALLIGLFGKKLGLIKLFPRLLPDYLVLPVLMLSFIFSFSRTGLVIFLVLSAAITGLIGKINLKAITLVLVFIIAFLVLIMTTPRDDVETFRGKIARSFREVVVREYTRYRDININWRGHETWLAMKMVKSGTLWQKMAGHGFGSVVDLNMTMILAGEEFTEIPILHNGYAYILVKTGILGLLCYAVFYLILLFRSRCKGDQPYEKEALCRVLLGSTLSLVLTMFVIGGMAEIHNSVYVLLVGFTVRRIEQIESVREE
jgi:hypothetical protein